MTKLYGVRLKATLHELNVTDDEAGAGTVGKVIGELLACSVKYALNTIPTASVSLPMGKDIANGDFNTNYNTPPLQLNMSQAVAIVLSVLSSNDSRVPVGNYCIFKGYITSISLARDASSVSFQLTLTHWLQDTSRVSLFSPLSSPDNPRDIAMHSVFETSIAGPDTAQGSHVAQPQWIFASSATRAEAKDLDIFSKIRIMLKAAIKHHHKRVGLQSVSLLIHASEAALDRIKPENLDFMPELLQSRELTAMIHNHLRAETATSYYSTTLWNKLLAGLLPPFLIAIVPSVSECYAIPYPGIKMTLDTPRKVIGADDYFSVNASRVENPMVGACLLQLPKALTSAYAPDMPIQISKYFYPNPPLQGPLKTVTLPVWLTNYIAATPNVTVAITSDVFKHLYVVDAAVDAKKRIENALKPILSDKISILDKLLNLYVKSYYLGTAFKQRMCSLAMPFRLDILPGMPVVYEPPQYTMNFNSNDLMYATVSSVAININGSTAGTTVGLENIRTSTELRNPVLSNTEGLLYKDCWSGLNHNLYEIVD